MESALGLPALAKVLLLFAAIVLFYKLKVPLWADLFLVSILTGLWFGIGAVRTAKYTAIYAVSAESLYLCAVVFLINGISNVMNETGVLRRLVDAMTALLGHSIRSSAALPALIGLLPMPGGAIFSAPMVETACATGSQTPEQKTAINYWFRHIIEYWWPLYPGVILATTLFQIPMWKMLIQIPLTLAAVTGGWFFILRPAFRGGTAASERENRDPRAPGREALRESAAIIVMIAAIFGVGPLMQFVRVGGIAAKYLPVIFGVILATIWLIHAERISPVKAIRTMASRNQISMLLLAAGIIVFKGMLMEAGTFKGVQSDLVQYHMPAVVVIAALPFIAGMVTGIAVGFVGASFPIVISLLPPAVFGSELRLAYLVLAFSFGYIGMMLSPVHLCLILTKDYFKAEFAGIYRLLLVPGIIVILTGVGLFFIYRAIL